MIDPDALNVWFEDRLVGYLWRNPTGAIGFRYEPERTRKEIPEIRRPVLR